MKIKGRKGMVMIRVPLEVIGLNFAATVIRGTDWTIVGNAVAKQIRKYLKK